MQSLNAFHLLSAMRKANADLYYCRVSKSYLPIVVWGSRRQKAISVWACSHDREVERFSPRTKRFLTKAIEYFEQWIFSWGLHRVHHRFAQSKKQRRLLVENYSLQGIVLENSHPLPTFKYEARENNIVWIANFREFKRPELYIELAKRLSDKSYRFLMIGEIFSIEIKNKFDQFSNEMKNFEYLGPISVKEVENLLWKCKLLVNTSTHEGFPNTFIQALMRGVPIISLNVNPDKIITDNSLGVVNPDLSVIVERIDELMKNESLWSKTSRDCRHFAENRFNIVNYTDTFLSEVGF